MLMLTQGKIFGKSSLYRSHCTKNLKNQFATFERFDFNYLVEASDAFVLGYLVDAVKHALVGLGWVEGSRSYSAILQAQPETGMLFYINTA